MNRSCLYEVFVYRNLNRKGIVFSLKCTKTHLVVARLERVIIKNAKLIVSQAGRARVLKEKRKNVHAGVRGKSLKRLPSNVRKLKKIQIFYNPYKTDGFIDKKGNYVTSASYVLICAQGVFAFL